MSHTCIAVPALQLVTGVELHMKRCREEEALLGLRCTEAVQERNEAVRKAEALKQYVEEARRVLRRRNASRMLRTSSPLLPSRCALHRCLRNRNTAIRVTGLLICRLHASHLPSTTAPCSPPHPPYPPPPRQCLASPC